MISLRGPKLKILAAVLAVIALAAGIYLTFFRSQGFVKTTGTIVSLREDSSDDSTVYFPTVEYTVDGKTYTGELDTGSGSYKVGKTIPVLYDPNDPAVVHDGSGVGIYFIVVKRRGHLFHSRWRRDPRRRDLVQRSEKAGAAATRGAARAARRRRSRPLCERRGA